MTTRTTRQENAYPLMQDPVGSEIVASRTPAVDVVDCMQKSHVKSLQSRGKRIEGLYPLSQSVVTPVRVGRLGEALKGCLEKEKVKFILDGFKNGFDLGFRGEVVATNPRNARSTGGTCPGGQGGHWKGTHAGSHVRSVCPSPIPTYSHFPSWCGFET